ncbi:MAG: hypothetical protein ACREKF_08985 [Candidatus Methylomirabilales bacterium]
MDKGPRIEQMRRYIRTREEELLSKLEEMSEDQLRWTVRLFADCLDETSQSLCLADYSEYLPFERMQAAVASLIPQYTQLALADLDFKAQVEGSGLNSLTEEELQNMSCAEKWDLLAQDQEAHTPSQLRRELARLLFCQNYDLYRDPSLPVAAIELPSYFEAQASLAKLPPGELQALKGRILPMTADLEKAPAKAQEEILGAIREEVARAIAFEKPLERVFEGAMERIPLGTKDVSEATPPLDTEGMSREDLQLSVRVLTDLLSLEEMRRELSPLKDRYPSLFEIPDAGLKDLVRSLAEKLGGRTTLSFTERYRSGRMLTRQQIAPDVWVLLPNEEKFRLLQEDNAAMDVGQMARHISRVFMSYQYPMLHDMTAQVSFLNEPFYPALQERIIGAFSEPSDREGLRELNRVVTIRMLEIERARPEDRETLLLEVRKGIAATLGLPDTLLYPEAER